ncbi:MAG TPA: heavy-metal-associated domain-containing protein [Vicinamibacterales bacterium]
MATTSRFGVTGMTCGGCERALRRAVGQLPGVQSVVASHSEHAATVTYDESSVTPEAIAVAIRNAGFEPDGASPA